MIIAFLYLKSKKIPKPIVARIIVLADVQKYFEISCKKNIAWMLHFTIKNGADPEAYRNYGSRMACDENNVDVLKILKQYGVNLRYDNDFLFCISSMSGHLEVVKYLHENGADMTCRHHFVIREACERGYLHIVKYLHQVGADIRILNDYPIRWASMKGHLNVVKYLHENGADIKTLGPDMILGALMYGHDDVVNYIKQFIQN